MKKKRLNTSGCKRETESTHTIWKAQDPDPGGPGKYYLMTFQVSLLFSQCWDWEDSLCSMCILLSGVNYCHTKYTIGTTLHTGIYRWMQYRQLYGKHFLKAYGRHHPSPTVTYNHGSRHELDCLHVSGRGHRLHNTFIQTIVRFIFVINVLKVNNSEVFGAHFVRCNSNYEFWTILKMFIFSLTQTDLWHDSLTDECWHPPLSWNSMQIVLQPSVW